MGAPQTRGFTGHEHIRQFNIINMNARLYDPKIGKFFSPDNYITDPGNPQSYNRYSYALNNPLKYTDPSGNMYYGLFGNGGYSEGYMAGVFDGIAMHNASSGRDEMDYNMATMVYIWFDGRDNALFFHSAWSNGGVINSDNVLENMADDVPEAPKAPTPPKEKEKPKPTPQPKEKSLDELIWDFVFSKYPIAIMAHNHYRYGLGAVMNVDAQRMNWSGITQKDLHHEFGNTYTLDFGKVRNGSGLLSHESIALGTVSLKKIGENKFLLFDDTYDHDQKEGLDKATRNFYTRALLLYDTFGGDPLTSYLLALNNSIYYIMGIEGQYGFKIHFYNNKITIPKH